MKQPTIPFFEESAQHFWQSVHEDWPGLPYSARLVAGLLNLFSDLQHDCGFEIARLLDLGAGSGNPSIGLAENGLQVVALDSDPEALSLIGTNASQRSVTLNAVNVDWLDDWPSVLMAKGEMFDCVICRGNSLIYVDTWNRSHFDATIVTRDILRTLENAYTVLRPGGFLYVDLTSRTELRDTSGHFESLGHRRTSTELIHLFWLVRYERASRKRVVEAFKVFHSLDAFTLNRVSRHRFVSLLLTHAELQALVLSAGFRLLKPFAEVTGEDHYDVFIFQKPKS